MELAEGLPLVHADSMQLEQALLNLCINSRDAMQENGTLPLSAEWFLSTETRWPIPCRPPVSMSLLMFATTGKG